MAHKQDYLEKVEIDRQRRLQTALISECFPDVSFIIIQLIYYLKGVNEVSMIRTINFWPSRHAYFNMDCMIKDCIDGGFDLTQVITHMVKKHEKQGKGNLSCKGKISNQSSQHSRVAYKIAIQYDTGTHNILRKKEK